VSNPTDSDLKDVAGWLRTTVDNLDIDYKSEPMSLYEKSAKEMYESYDEFPKDKKRTDKIIKLLKKGESPLPIYVEKDDPYNFVMEGRHRMVAFYLLGHKEVMVARVSSKNKNKIKV